MPDPARRQTKSKYTEGRNIPGHFEGETVTRRRFMVGSVHGLGAVAAAAFTLPALAFAFALAQTEAGKRLPEVSPDYWEVSERRVTLGTAAPLAAGL